jgi:hypothetical protein
LDGCVARTLDYTPLTRPYPAAEVRAWRRQAKASGAPWAAMGAGNIVGLVVLVPVVLVMLFFATTTIGSIAQSGFVGGAPAILILMVVIFGGVLAFFVWRMLGGGSWRRWARIDAFARANGLTFSPRDAVPGYAGMIFQLGTDRRIQEHVCSTAGRFLDIGDYQYTTGSGKNRSTHRWGFLALRLDRRLPNMVLDSKANNRLFGSNLPVAFSRDQLLHLEGDFDRYFTLYCPREYETDALYVFTPDLMALLIDEAAPFDVEIVDDWMFVYSSQPFDMIQPDVYDRAFRILDTIGAKAVRQTERYADDRVGDRAANLVAPQGARLRRGVSAGTIVIGIVVAGVLIYSFVSGAH